MPKPRRHNYPPYADEYEPKAFGIVAPQLQQAWADSAPESTVDKKCPIVQVPHKRRRRNGQLKPREEIMG